MSEEVQGVVTPTVDAPSPASPEVVDTAVTTEAPVSGEQQPEAKTFTQEELDAIVAKRIAKAQRKAERDADRRIAEFAAQRQPVVEQPADKPTPDKFTTTEDYVEALSEWKANQVITKRDNERQQQEQQRRQREAVQAREAEWSESVSKAEEKYDDFVQVAQNPQLPVSQVMADAMKSSPVGAEIAYYLGKNPAEAERIFKLNPFLAVKEMGKLEAKVESNPPEATKKPSAAPAPIKPVNGKAGSNVIDTTDPKSLEKLGTSEWIRQDRLRRQRLMEAQGKR